MSRPDDLRDRVRDRYAAAANAVTGGTTASCCGVTADGTVQDVEIGDGFGAELYAGEDRDALPAEAVAASLGCGNPSPSRTCTRARPCSTWVRAGASTCCCPPAAWAPPEGPTGST